MRKIAQRVLERWAAGWSDALASAVAAGLAWALAHQLFGHPQPVFAAVAAVICLAPGLPSRGGQAVNMMLGLVTGILVGEILLALPVLNAGARVSLIVFIAMMAALSFGLAPVIAIQGGVSALLVIALGPIAAGPTRLADALVGTATAVVFSQLLLTPDPVRMIDDAVKRMLQLMAQGFAQSAEALSGQDRAKAEAALTHFFSSRQSLDAVVAGIGAARSLARWSVRGRLAARQVNDRAQRYERRAMRLFASTLLFAEELANALRRAEEPPGWLAGRVRMVADLCAALGDGAGDGPSLASTPLTCEAAPESWQACLEHLRGVEDTLRTLQEKTAAQMSLDA